MNAVSLALVPLTVEETAEVKYSVEVPIAQNSLEVMPTHRKRSSEHIAEHTVDDPVPLVDEKRLDDALQFSQDAFHQKQVPVGRYVLRAQAYEREIASD